MKVAWISGLVIALAVAAGACSQTFPEWKRGNSFSVIVMLNGTPIKRMRVLLAPEDERRTSHQRETMTDDDGVARFSDIKPGTYYIEAVRLDVKVGPGTVIVSERGSSEGILVEWPLRPAYTVATGAGRFERHLFPKNNPIDGFIHPQGTPLASVTLTLSRVDSEKQVGRVLTDSKGDFDFGAVEPGAYLLHIDETESPQSAYPIDDYFLVYVDPTTSRRDLRLRVLWTSCGITATDLQ